VFVLKENEVLEKSIRVFTDCLSLVPALKVETVETLSGKAEPNFRVTIRGIGVDQIIYVTVRSLGTPKSTREAVNALSVYQRKEPSYGIFVAPFISSVSANICKEAGIGYMDLSGNCWIAFKQVFINRENRPNQYPFKTGLSSLCFPKSERVLRVLLTFPYRPWKTIELADEALVSPGMITHVRRRLEEEEWIKTIPEGLYLSQPDNLLMDWSKHYSLQQNKLFDFYTLKPLADIEAEIGETCDGMNIPYALTGFSASNCLAPMVRGQRVMVYINRDIPLLAERLGLKSVDSGANVILIQPYDAGVLWNAQMKDGIQTATPVQVFLDLKRTPGRGEEAADFLYKEVIKPTWQQQKIHMTTSM
jgi:hypothetical protein